MSGTADSIHAWERGFGVQVLTEQNGTSELLSLKGCTLGVKLNQKQAPEIQKQSKHPLIDKWMDKEICGVCMRVYVWFVIYYINIKQNIIHP